MSAEPRRSSTADPWEHVTTHVYDADGNCTGRIDPDGKVTTFGYDCVRPAVSGAPAAPVPRYAWAAPPGVEVFEFRLCGSETQEQARVLSGPGPWAAAARTVRAYLPRAGEAGVAAAIGGLEVNVGVCAGQLVCMAALSDFTAADLVVVQVEVVVYRTGT